MSLSRDLETAIRIAQEAGDLSMQWFRSNHLDVDTKADGSPVTVADRTVERRLRELVAAVDPDAGIVGEEEGVTQVPPVDAGFSIRSTARRHLSEACLCSPRWLRFTTKKARRWAIYVIAEWRRFSRRQRNRDQRSPS